MHWQLRFLRNSLVALLPAQSALRKAKRRLLPYESDLDDWTVEQGIRMVEMLVESGAGLQGGTALELGSGWKPAIPLLLRAAGVRIVILTDAQRLLDSRLLRDTATHLAQRADLIAERLRVSADSVRERLRVSEAGSFEELLGSLQFTYLAPIDARRLPIKTGSMDIILSRAVLEHIPQEIVRDLFLEFARILKPRSGRACHVVDNSDHWAHGDRRLSKLNFLRYSDAAWRWFALNPLDFMNRMRHSEYLELLESTGFEIVLDLSQTDHEALAELQQLCLDPKFLGFEKDDLAVLTSYIVSALSQPFQSKASVTSAAEGRG